MPRVQLAAPAFSVPIRVRRLSDSTLSDHLAAGDRWALDEIYRRHAPALCRYARRYVDDALAQDAVHDALANTQLALLGRGRAVDLRPWLYRCVRNACLSELDRAGRRCAELPGEPVAAGGADSCDVVACTERLLDALRCMGDLPPRQREALRLRALEGRGYDELAAHFDLTENASVQLVHRARRNLLALVA